MLVFVSYFQKDNLNNDTSIELVDYDVYMNDRLVTSGSLKGATIKNYPDYFMKYLTPFYERYTFEDFAQRNDVYFYDIAKCTYHKYDEFHENILPVTNISSPSLELVIV